MSHIPVMLNECLAYFEDTHLRVFFDGTLGLGGHAEALLDAHPEIELYIGCDRDLEAIEASKKRLQKWTKKVAFVHGNFADLDEHLKQLGITEVNGFFLTWECHPCN